MNKNNQNQGEIVLYRSEDGQLTIEVKLENETVWLNQSQICKLFQRDQSVISRHINNVFKEGELEEKSNMQFLHIPNSDKPVVFYNLDVIISVGYRVKSLRGTQFRIWATQKLKEYIIKGFVLDDERLAQGKTKKGYYDELLGRVREIRASEQNFYIKLKDIFATSVDYDPKTEYAKDFYATVQNKFHYAVTGKTAAEIVSKRISSKKKNLGLTNWKGKKPTREQAEIAKNYLLETELRQLYLLVEQFLSYAELRIERRRPMHMKDWQKKLEGFLKLNDMKILTIKGKISHEEMEKRVKKELEKYLKNN